MGDRVPQIRPAPAVPAILALGAPPLVAVFDPRELMAVGRHLRVLKERPVPGSRFPLTLGTIDGHPVGLVRLPFGDDPDLLVRVARGALTVAGSPSIITLGTAMAMAPDLEVGDVVVVMEARRDGRTLPLVRGVAGEVLAACPHTVRARRARAITTDRFVDDAAVAQALLCLDREADVVEMEDFHLAGLAADCGVGHTSIRAITDRGRLADHLAHLDRAAATTAWLLRRTLGHLSAARMLRAIENPSTRDMPYGIVVHSTVGSLTAPDAVALARRTVRGLGIGAVLTPGGRLDVVVALPERWAGLTACPSGQARVTQTTGSWRVLIDPVVPYVRVILAPGAADAPAGTLSADVAPTPVGVEAGLPIGRHTVLGSVARVHVQGLNSTSAEPEEGLLAATTIEELTVRGLEVVGADEAAVWVYRTANAQQASYFEPPYSTPMRPAPPLRPAGASTNLPSVPTPGGVGGDPGALLAGSYRIATGLGPAIDPAAAGGRDAHTLLVGDEQGGRLAAYLDDLAAGPVGPEDVLRHEGVVQRLGDDTFVLSRIDRRPVLTSAGLNALRFEPRTLRSVYSLEYDRFLAGYFGVTRRRRRSVGSHLLLTSRGCGYQCGICCSGGLQPFAALDPALVADLLARTLAGHRLGPGDLVDIYLVDSYFNRVPERVVRIADRLEESGLLPFLALHVRHSGLLSFLRRRAEGTAPPVVHTDVIRAYRRLGIDEIVLGVDAFTDRSIRRLKTSVGALARKGAQARPAYTFADIEAVLCAIEAEGLASRCFLLAYDPFASDADRIETYYNLLSLSLKLRRFRIDTDSSERVNELKPFEGAPITEAARKVPGLVVDGRFRTGTPLGDIEDLFDLGAFGRPRRGPADRRRLLASAGRVRLRLGRLLAGRIDDRRVEPGGVPPEVLHAASAFVEHDMRLEPRLMEAVDREAAPAGPHRETGRIREALAGALERLGPLPPDPATGREAALFALLSPP